MDDVFGVGGPPLGALWSWLGAIMMWSAGIPSSFAIRWRKGIVSPNSTKSIATIAAEVEPSSITKARA